MVYQNVLTKDVPKITKEEETHLLALKLWIEQQSHLRTRTDDQFLIQFLRDCEYDREKAQQKLDVFYALKTKYPEMFAVYDVDNPKFREVHNLGCFTVMPLPLFKNGPRLVVVNFDYNACKYSIEDIFMPGAAMLELLLLHDSYARTHGVVYIVDYGKAFAGHFMQFTLLFCKKLATFFEKSLPLHTNHVYYINSSPAAEEFFKILLPQFSEKLRKKITIIDQDREEIAKYIPYEYLPAEYGGQNSSCQEAAKVFNTTWDLHRGHFKQNANFGVFGASGSIGQLCED